MPCSRAVAVVIGPIETMRARSGNATGAHAAAKSLRDLWDADQASLQPLDQTGWTSIDAQMDKVLKTFGIDHANPPIQNGLRAVEHLFSDQQREVATLRLHAVLGAVDDADVQLFSRAQCRTSNICCLV